MIKGKPGGLNVIEQIEKLIEKDLNRLNQETITMTNGYTVGAKGAVIGLNLNNTGISDISLIKDLKHLTYLDLSSNRLGDISPLNELKALRVLHLSSNRAQEMFDPQETEKQRDEFVFIRGKPLDISPLRELTALTELYLDDNELSHLSPLKGLKGLTILSLNTNRFSDLAPLKELNALTELYLSKNRVSELSPIIGLKKLKRLNAAHNDISQLPMEIVQLGLEIKWEFGSGSGIFLEGNPLETPPIEIVKQGTAAVQNYFKEMEQTTVRLLESKLLIVGNGEVGKTTLMKKLKDSHFQVSVGQEPTTHGINILPWELDCQFEDGAREKVKIHCWDFGGQDIYHATHQFFLTKRSLYLFVWEARKEEESRSFNYWLNIIKLLSAGSPVLVVMNKSDLRIKHIDEASFKDKFTNIVSFLQVSCLTGFGIPELTGQIKVTLGKMKHLRDELPGKWVQIRDHLKREAKYYISLNDYFAICKKYYLNEEKAEFLSGYLHDLGVILHYRHDSLLENTVILNPEWATEAVYKLVDTREILENKGRFHFPDLKKYWDSSRYPREKHPQLIRLMEKFELCFPITGTDIHIVPELLPTVRPAIDFEKYKTRENLRFQYHYDFMPEGIISRFISRMYYLIKDDRFWKNGVELRLEDSTAMVISDPLNRKMEISVTGPSKSELRAITRNEFDHIHQTLNMEKSKHYDEMIPCNCSECSKSPDPHFFQYEVLKRILSKNKASTICPKSIEDVSISQLLMGFEPPEPKKDLLKTIINTALNLKGIAGTIRPDEDSRNGFIALLLSIHGFTVKEQTRWGRSGSGKTPGAPGIILETAGKETGAVIETFNLSGFNRTVIDAHLAKLFSYDTGGPVDKFIVVYSEALEFHNLWEKYLAHLRGVNFKYRLDAGPEEETTPSGDIKLARTGYLYEGKEIMIYHLFINMSTG